MLNYRTSRAGRSLYLPALIVVPGCVSPCGTRNKRFLPCSNQCCSALCARNLKRLRHLAHPKMVI